jgi:choline dehydrogenase-like flavoprotein
MKHDPPPAELADDIPATSLNRASTEVDYIIVGSGPGGAPLACRLAQAGMNVLVLEAGMDAGAIQTIGNHDPAEVRRLENERLLYYCPGLHASSTEPERYPKCKPVPTSWAYFVSHYSADKREVYYPRASAIGGCACHNAMISVYGTDCDWRRLADLTGDESWSPDRMRMVYQQIERLRYLPPASRLGRAWERFLNWLNPGRGSAGERGEHGWLDITTSNPNLAIDDRQLFRLISSAFFAQAGLSKTEALFRLAKLYFEGNFYRDFDLNDAERMKENPEGIAMVPIAITPDSVRRGPREFLLETRHALKQEHGRGKSAGRLQVVTQICVGRVILDEKERNPAHAIGVEFMRGAQLYGASKPSAAASAEATGICYCRREVILSAGTFNTPQLLMLSGIGDRNHLIEKGVTPMVELPGVGSGLRDRCEISVISAMKKPFSLLTGALFQPDDSDDEQLKAWEAANSSGPRQGIYTSNGAALAILKRSRPSDSPLDSPPDLFILGFPAAFRGYYEGWSRDLFHAAKDGTQTSYNLWSWVILKAYTQNSGTVRLRTNKPCDPPLINFKYFGDNASPSPGADPDMEALVDGVEFVRQLNGGAGELFAEELQPGPQKQRESGLRPWIAQEAWGHHPCGTCRIGSDTWKANPADLLDRGAVLDSRFRVHGVRGLRVVDASVFPEIPGYFIVVPVYMVSEKAATTILDELSR